MAVEGSVLALSPGTHSTRMALFRGPERLWAEEIPAGTEDPSETRDPLENRRKALERVLGDRNASLEDLRAVVGRGGVVGPVPGGIYAVEDRLALRLARDHPRGHVANLGGLLARALALPRGVPALMGDPISTDEMDAVARITGWPELPRRSLAHALSVKAAVHRAARDLGKPWETLRAVVAHLGSGTTVCAHAEGRMVDVSNPNDFGPFSLDQAGGVPAGDLARLCFSGAYTLQDVRTALAGAGGMRGYLGTDDLGVVASRRDEGDEEARRVYDAMAYQVAREIGALAVSLGGSADAVILTGPVAEDPMFVDLVRAFVQWIAPVCVYPGGDDLQFLAEGARRVLEGRAPLRRYGDDFCTREG